MIRFALIVASTLGFVLTAALGNFMAPLLQELERFRPQEQQEPQTPVQSRVPALGGLWQMLMGTALVPLENVWPTILTYSLAGGALVGGLGSMFSIRKHLNV